MALSLNESPGYPSTQDAQVRCDLAETSAGRSSVFAADVSKFIPSRTLFTRIRVCEEMSQHHSKLNHVSTTPTEDRSTVNYKEAHSECCQSGKCTCRTFSAHGTFILRRRSARQLCSNRTRNWLSRRARTIAAVSPNMDMRVRIGSV